MITYLKGDATKPKSKDNKIIAHICNDIARWGKGFVMAISKRWSQPRKDYMALKDYSLGTTQFIPVEDDLWIANMIAQHKIYSKNKNERFVRYSAIRSCLKEVANKAQELKASVHMPRIGAGLGGGDWDIIEKIIEEELCEKNIEVFVYEL